MSTNTRDSDVPLLPKALKQQADALRAQAQALDVLAALASREDNDRLLTEGEVMNVYGMGRDALRARGVPEALVGRKTMWRKSDIETSIASHAPTHKLAKATRVGRQGSVDPLEAAMASGSVIARDAKVR